MNRHAHVVIGALAFLMTGLFATRASADLISATDVNPDPNIFEAYLTAVEKDVTIGGKTVHAMVYKDDPPFPDVSAGAGIPGPVIRLKVGEMVIVHFKNSLSSLSAAIHWHGIELDNDSDGTAVTQDVCLPGQSYTYRFKTFRPGLFWYHNHMLPGNTTFAGMYGPIIIENNIEASLKGTVLPADADTKLLVLSDIEFDATGKVGIPFKGSTITVNEVIQLCHLYADNEPGGDVTACGAGGTGHIGDTVLVNGVKPDPGTQTPMFTVPSGKRIRLQLFSEAVSRHFRLKLLGSGDNKLYRVGGMGGLLDRVRLEGGTKGTWDTKYDLGEIVLGSGERSDVIVVPSGAEGAVITLVGNPFFSNLSAGLPANYPIAYFKISGTSTDTPPADGDPILVGTAEKIENLKILGPTTPLVSPAPFGGSDNETIRLTIRPKVAPKDKVPAIDDIAAMLDTNVGNGDFPLVPRPSTSRYAHVGELLELAVRNETSSAHPYHLHGFSMQPVAMLDNGGPTLYNFDYEEFLDTVDVYPGQTLVFRVRLDDRAKMCDLSPSFPPGPTLAPCADAACGGAVGRWLFHCHIFYHGGLGMMGELTVLPGPDAPPTITCPADIVKSTDPGLCSAVVNFVVTATDDCGTPSVVCVPPSGSTFAKGTTTVNCTATDSIGQTSMCSFTVTVNDTEPPVISGQSVDKTSLWPPNHKMVDILVSYTATDNCGATCVLSVTSNEPINGLGDGDTAPDWIIIDDHHLQLRAERAGNGPGRIYTIKITCTDASGNSSNKSLQVTVPHSKDARALPHNAATRRYSGTFQDEAGRTRTARLSVDSRSGSRSAAGIPERGSAGKSPAPASDKRKPLARVGRGPSLSPRS